MHADKSKRRIGRRGEKGMQGDPSQMGDRIRKKRSCKKLMLIRKEGETEEEFGRWKKQMHNAHWAEKEKRGNDIEDRGEGEDGARRHGQGWELCFWSVCDWCQGR